MDYGYLIVTTRAANEAYPINSARVSVYNSNTNELMQEVYTDQNGSSPRIALPAPTLSPSEEPGRRDPYARYNLVIEKEGYYTVRSLNVPVASEITSLQAIEMRPVLPSDFPLTPETEIVIDESMG